MGYESSFVFKVLDDGIPDADLPEEVIDFLKSKKDEDVLYGLMLYILEEGWGKFYEFDKCMINLSMEFPKLTFYVEREGEEFGDIEKNYYRNGKANRNQFSVESSIEFDLEDEED
jgi:hypothetical protein